MAMNNNHIREQAVSAMLEYYKLKYSNSATRLTAAKADYVNFYESINGLQSKTVGSTAANGQTVSFMITLSSEEKLSVFASVIKRMEGSSFTTFRPFIRETTFDTI